MPIQRVGNGRSRWLKIRASPEELATWHTKAASAGMTVSAFLRTTLNGTRQKRSVVPATDRDTLLVLTRISCDLNEIARWVNHHKSGVEAVAVIARLIGVERALRQAASACDDHVD